MTEHEYTEMSEWNFKRDSILSGIDAIKDAFETGEEEVVQESINVVKDTLNEMQREQREVLESNPEHSNALQIEEQIEIRDKAISAFCQFMRNYSTSEGRELFKSFLDCLSDLNEFDGLVDVEPF